LNQNGQIYLFAFFIILSGCDSIKGKSERSTQPNIILIMANDLGYSGIVCYGYEKEFLFNLDEDKPEEKIF
jgi:hypothetical protein